MGRDDDEFDARIRKSKWAKELVTHWKAAHAEVLGMVVGGLSNVDRRAVIRRLRRAMKSEQANAYLRQLAGQTLTQIERNPPAVEGEDDEL